MSFVNDEKDLCFIHIAKTAGTSISTALKKSFTSSTKLAIGHPLAGTLVPTVFNEDGTLKAAEFPRNTLWGDGEAHCTYYQATKEFPESCEKWYAFAVVRNPIDRVASAARHFGINDPREFDVFIQLIEEYAHTSPAWHPDVWWDDYRKQANLSLLAPPHIVPCNFYFNHNHKINLFSFERLNEIEVAIKEKFGVILTLPATKHDPDEALREYQNFRKKISRNLLTRIEQVYEKDFEIYEKVSSCVGPYEQGKQNLE